MSTSIKGENCTLTYIRGVKVLEDYDGNDLLKVLKKGSKDSGLEIDKTVMNLLTRIDALEKFVKNIQVNPVSEKGEKGERGEKGEKGEDGSAGPQGPRGKDGAKTISELKDVCLDGLDDGDILTWSSSKNQWVASRD